MIRSVMVGPWLRVAIEALRPKQWPEQKGRGGVSQSQDRRRIHLRNYTYVILTTGSCHHCFMGHTPEAFPFPEGVLGRGGFENYPYPQ